MWAAVASNTCPRTASAAAATISWIPILRGTGTIPKSVSTVRLREEDKCLSLTSIHCYHDEIDFYFIAFNYDCTDRSGTGYLAKRRYTPPDEQGGTVADAATRQIPRSEERRVGKECIRKCKSRRSPYH